jgi:hypothetical protein
MCSSNHTTNEKKRLEYVNPNLINQLQLNPQINENGEKYKKINVKSKITTKKVTIEKMSVVSTYLGRNMLWLQDKACIIAPYTFK